MTRDRIIFLLAYPIVCFFVFVYPILRLLQWMKPAFALGLIETLVLLGVSIIALWYSFSGPKKYIRYVVVHWMGVGFILATVTLVAELIRLIAMMSNSEGSPVSDVVLGQGVLTIGMTIVIGSILFSHHLSVKRHQIQSPKLTRHYRIAQISDVHIGSRQGGYMTRIVNKLNTLSPDYVVITGDLIDSSAVGYEELESLKNISAKTYFCIGNHERYADLDKILDIAAQLGITTLRQQVAEEGELSFIGVDDAGRVDQLEIMLPTIELNKSSYQILLYHRPNGWYSARAHDIDLMLSGHTHNGQIFPFNFLVKQQFKRIKGMHIEQGKRLYVSCGTGTWGPLMRLGSSNEISVFELQPKRDKS